MVNPDLIKDFRIKVNDNSYFALEWYKNIDGRNHWNLICSCMDWIDVAIDYITHKPVESGNINIKCMQAYTYITAIDIIWQSIQQLHRVILDKESIPFAGEKKIFLENKICKDDNEYFKHIRAVFGAHPVNLNQGGRRFASWPTDHVYDQYDYAVILYSATIDEEDIVFGYSFRELDEFLESRYGYLGFLMEEIENQYQCYRKSKINEVIEQTTCIMEQLKILKKALKERLNNDYYSYIIDNLLRLYQAQCNLPINRDVVEKYLKRCQALIPELLSNLQNMEFTDLKNGDLINLRYPHKIHYQLSKIYECLNGNKDDYLYSYYLSETAKFLKDFVTINDDMGHEEVYLLIQVGLYNYWKRNSKLAKNIVGDFT